MPLRRSRSILCASIASLAIVAASALHAQTSPLPSLPKHELIVSADPASFTLAGAGKAKADLTTVSVSGQPFAKAWRAVVKEKAGGDYNVQLLSPLKATLKKGDVVLMTAYARMIDTADESGEGRFGLVLEQAKEPHGKVFAASFGVTREWQRFDVPATIDQDFSQTGGQFTIRLGAYVQTLEIGGVEVRTFPAGTDVKSLPKTKVSYAGRELNAPWRKSAAERIEKIRKADLAVRVIDASGKPVPDARVEVKMTRHAFPFGSCYAPRMIVDADNPTAKKYRETFLANFNYGVDEFAQKWPHWVEPQSRQLALDSLKWMNDRDIPVRGHTMVWPAWKRLPPAIKELSGDPEKLRAAVRDHIASVGTTLKGKVVDWDVVNEPFANNDLLKILGEDVMAEWFKLAREADPTAVLYLNETSVPTAPPHDERYTVLYNRAARIKELGAPIGGVGMQAHFGQNVQPPVQLLQIYDRFEKLGLPMRITELDIDVNDEQLQADYYRDFLTATFSHPNLNGVLIWGFWESAHWRPLAAMYRKDWSPRPIAGVWRDLVYKQWWTTADGKTSPAGTFATRGFLGDYDVTVTANGKTTTTKLSLPKDGATPTLTLR